MLQDLGGFGEVATKHEAEPVAAGSWKMVVQEKTLQELIAPLSEPDKP